jgi:hypothetical protein
MAENKLVGSLVLRTIDITQTDAPCLRNTVNTAIFDITDNSFGRCEANGCVVTWRGVNLRMCLGELYNKYKKFNLKLTNAQIRQYLNPAATDCQFIIYISGFPFCNSTYNTRLGNTSQAALGCVNFLSTGSAGATTNSINGLVSFDKPLNDVCDITIELKNSSTNVVNGFTEKPTQGIGHWCIIMDIYGVVEDHKK